MCKHRLNFCISVLINYILFEKKYIYFRKSYTSRVIILLDGAVMMYKHSNPPGYDCGYNGELNSCALGIARSSPPHLIGSV